MSDTDVTFPSFLVLCGWCNPDFASCWCAADEPQTTRCQHPYTSTTAWSLCPVSHLRVDPGGRATSICPKHTHCDTSTLPAPSGLHFVLCICAPAVWVCRYLWLQVWLSFMPVWVNLPVGVHTCMKKSHRFDSEGFFVFTETGQHVPHYYTNQHMGGSCTPQVVLNIQVSVQTSGWVCHSAPAIDILIDHHPPVQLMRLITALFKEQRAADTALITLSKKRLRVIMTLLIRILSRISFKHFSTWYYSW